MSEAVWIWGGAILLVLVAFIPYAVKFTRRASADRIRLREAMTLGLDQPTTQHPIVDELACIGCGACVDACPEGDVLGVVNGRASIVNGLRCVGHSRCAEACPVGAIKIGLGAVWERSDIPILSEHNETSVPGVYIAGELSGFALIRNAVQQGKLVADHIATVPGPREHVGPTASPMVVLSKESARIHQGTASKADVGRPPESKGDNDTGSSAIVSVLVVGAGPAGLSAALRSRELGLSCRVLDQDDAGGTILNYPRKKLVLTQPVDIPLWGKLNLVEYPKEKLLEIWQEIPRRFDIDLRTKERVMSITKQGALFEVGTSNGTHRARHVVLATGRRGTPRRLEVPGEELPKVAYRLTDAESYQGKHVLVVGGGDSAIEAALGLGRQQGNTVTISYRRSVFARIKKRNSERLEPALQIGQVRPLFESAVVEIREKSVVLEVPGGRVELENDYVFVLIGGTPPYELLKSIGVRFGGENIGQAPVAAPSIDRVGRVV